MALVGLGFSAGGVVVRSGSGTSPDPVGRGVVVFFAVAAGSGGSEGSTSAAAACGQRVPNAMSGGGRLPPSCQTQASVSPGSGS